MDGGGPIARAALEHTIRTLPVPTSPPPAAREDAAVGLAFLEMALRQNHIRRITDRLVLVEHLRVARSTEVDVSLSLLDADQWAACATFRTRPKERRWEVGEVGAARVMRPKDGAVRPAAPAILDRDGHDDRPSLWVPIARLPRSSSAPVEVRDSTGARVPRLTQLELALPTASGLYQLLRATLNSQTDAVTGPGDTGRTLNRFLKRADPARWLVESAVHELFAGRSQPPSGYPLVPDSQTSREDDNLPRNIALKVLREYGSQLAPFFDLLNLALNDYLLVVALPGDRDHHILSYDLPLLAEPPSRVQRPRAFTRALTRGTYLIKYQTQVPVGLRAYHLVAMADLSLDIDRMFLTSDADAEHVDSLTTDMRSLAEEIGKHARTKSTTWARITEHELQKTFGELSELKRRRTWEAEKAPARKLHTRHIDKLTSAWQASQDLQDVADQSTPLVSGGELTAERLTEAAWEIDRLEFHKDYWTEGDPSAPTASVYWRQRYGHRSSSAESITITAGIAVSDATSSHPRTIFKYVAAVLVVGLAAAIVGARDFWPFAADAEISFSTFDRSAVVAVLLIVPGFLYTRLDLPRRGTIAARVQTLPRLAAHLTILTAIVQALVVAGGASQWYRESFGLGCILLGILAISLLAFDLGSRMLPGLAPGAPRWVEGSDRRRKQPVDMSLYSSGAERGRE